MNYDRIILDLLNRVAALEEEVKSLKTKSFSTEIDVEPISYGSKDTTKYMLDGKRYGKNRLVLAIVQKYMADHPHVSAQQLMRVFDKSLQGSLGVVRTYEDAKNAYADSSRRFFMQPDEIIHTATTDCVVCTQWGAFNIDYLIARAEELGFVILRV